MAKKVDVQEFDILVLQNILLQMSRNGLQELADASGVGLSTLYKYQAGSVVGPRTSTMQKLLPHLGLTLYVGKKSQVVSLPSRQAA